MALPTTLTALKTQLENTTGVIEVLTTENAKASPYSIPVWNVRFLYQPADTADDISFPVFRREDDTIIYYKRIPDILRPETVQRDHYLTEKQIEDRIEAGDVNKDVISVNVNYRGDMDQASVEYVLSGQVVSDTYIIRQANAPQWVQPTGAHDAYNAGDKYVTHNSKIWENTHGDGNSWEPGGVDIADTIWKEITEDELIHMNPRSKA